MKLAYINIEPKNIGLPGELEIRHYPDAKMKFLTYQIGRTGVRPEMQPVFGHNHTVTHEIKTGKLATLFIVMAWGTSLERAKDMFFSNSKKEEGK